MRRVIRVYNRGAPDATLLQRGRACVFDNVNFGKVKMKVKVNEAEDNVLDYLVGVCEGKHKVSVDTDSFDGTKRINYGGMYPEWSSNWQFGGEIIEREGISLECDEFARWHANGGWSSDEPLLSAMRCYVVSKLGDEVEVPDEFK